MTISVLWCSLALSAPLLSLVNASHADQVSLVQSRILVHENLTQSQPAQATSAAGTGPAQATSAAGTGTAQVTSAAGTGTGGTAPQVNTAPNRNGAVRSSWPFVGRRDDTFPYDRAPMSWWPWWPLSHVWPIREGTGRWRTMNGRCLEQTTKQTLDLEELSRASWFIQAQQITYYQGRNTLRCVVATYNVKQCLPLEGAFCNSWYPNYVGPTLDVQHYYKDNNGRPKGYRTCAANTELGKMKLQPCYYPFTVGTDFWVLDVGLDANGFYDWVVISGGQPFKPTRDGKCSTYQGIYNSGLWIGSRQKKMPPATLEMIYQRLRSRGISTSKLKQVPQGEQQCGTYADMGVKADTREPRTTTPIPQAPAAANTGGTAGGS